MSHTTTTSRTESRSSCDDVLVAAGGNGTPRIGNGTSRAAAVEQVALDVLGRVDIGGQLITRRMVRERLNELSAHRKGCHCGLCALLPLTTELKVWRCASRWQADVNQTRLLARR